MPAVGGNLPEDPHGEHSGPRGRLFRQAVLNLQGRNAVPYELTGEAYDEREMLALASRSQRPGGGASHPFPQGHGCTILFEQPRQAVELFKEAESYLLYGAGHYLVPLFYFYDTLAHAASAGSRAPDELPKVLERIDRNLAQLEGWVRFAPMNHQHKKDLMEAEKARLETRYPEAAALYERAVRGAEENGFLNEEALACELCGKFWTERGQPGNRAAFPGEGHRTHTESGGAEAKVDQLQTLSGPVLVHSPPRAGDIPPEPEAAQTTGRSSSADWLDINSLLKVSRILTQTVQLSDLLSEMVKILLENAGAEKVLILHREEEMWFVMARGRVGGPGRRHRSPHART